MHEKLTAVFQKSPYGYIGYVEELPGANTQGITLEETKSLNHGFHLSLPARQSPCSRQTSEEILSCDSDV
jgi:hypothetical protein